MKEQYKFACTYFFHEGKKRTFCLYVGHSICLFGVCLVFYFLNWDTCSYFKNYNDHLKDVISTQLSMLTIIMGLLFSTIFFYKESKWNESKEETVLAYIDKNYTHSQCKADNPNCNESVFEDFKGSSRENIKKLDKCSGAQNRFYAWNIIVIAMTSLISALFSQHALIYKSAYQYNVAYSLGVGVIALLLFHLMLTMLPTYILFRIRLGSGSGIKKHYLRYLQSREQSTSKADTVASPLDV